MKRLRTAVVGVGSLGKHHLRWLHRIPESDLVGFYDTDPAKQKSFFEEYKGDIRAFTSLEELSQHAEAVSIVVPTSVHCEVASFLMGKGIHCLLEKPIAGTLEEAQLLIDKARVGNADLKLSVGHIERFNPAVQAVLAQKVAPAFIEAHRLAAFDPRGTDVAVVRDLMIHDIDLALTFIHSKIVNIQASAVAVVSEQADIANARLTFENGAVANLTASRISLHQMRKLRIFQQSGYYSLDLAKKQADMYQLADPHDRTMGGFRVPLGKSGQDLLYTKVTDTGEDMLKQELTAFLKSILNDRPVIVSLNQATEALRWALEVERIGQESLKRMLTSTPQA